MCIIGPSGSGKSTFLRAINHLEKVNRGRLGVDGALVGYVQRGDKLYELHDKEVAKRRAEIGMVFQRFNLFPHKTALENVIEAPRLVRGLSKAQATTEATELLARVGLSDKLASYPAQLSGGQPRHGRGLTRPGRAEQDRVGCPGPDPLLDLGDRGRLVTRGHHIGDDLERRHSALQVSYRTHRFPFFRTLQL